MTTRNPDGSVKKKVSSSTIAAAVVVPLVVLAVIGLAIGWTMYQKKLHEGPQWRRKEEMAAMTTTKSGVASSPSSVVIAPSAPVVAPAATAATVTASPTDQAPRSTWAKSSKPSSE